MDLGQGEESGVFAGHREPEIPTAPHVTHVCAHRVPGDMVFVMPSLLQAALPGPFCSSSLCPACSASPEQCSAPTLPHTAVVVDH